MTTVISVENLSKSYRLGQIGTGTFAHDLNAWWAKARGKPNPMLRIGETDHGNRDGEVLWALRDVSFTVKQGEVLGIIGKNGAGKSTLLKILSRVTAPTSGKVKVKGRIASLLEVGTGFHPEMTGRENIYLNGAIMGMTRKEIRRKFDEIVDFSGVEQFIDTPVKRYSSGMYVRLAFAVAAHLEPEILVVDEVLAVGDAEFQKKCLGKMGEVAGEGRTVLFVSHNMGMITELCSQCILFVEGKLAVDNSASVAVRKYLDSTKATRASNVDTTAMPRRPGEGKSIRITRVHLPLGTDIPFREPIDIELEYKVSKDLTEVTFGISIYELGGQCMITAAGGDAGKLINLKKQDGGCIHVQIKYISLPPGTYFLRVGISSGAQVLDWLGQVTVFDISEVGVSSHIIAKPHLGLRPPTVWKHEIYIHD